jgi:hypothetical protein
VVVVKGPGLTVQRLLKHPAHALQCPQRLIAVVENLAVDIYLNALLGGLRGCVIGHGPGVSKCNPKSHP